MSKLSVGAICTLMIVLAMLGGVDTIERVIGKVECERSLPRDQGCIRTVVWSVKPEGSKP